MSEHDEEFDAIAEGVGENPSHAITTELAREYLVFLNERAAPLLADLQIEFTESHPEVALFGPNGLSQFVLYVSLVTKPAGTIEGTEPDDWPEPSGKPDDL